MTKYGAKRTRIDDIDFDSKAESARYLELRELQRQGAISGLELQPEYKCIVNGQLVCKYLADFRYVDSEGRIVIEDVKGYRGGASWSVFRLKAKLVRALFGVEVEVVS